jgi:hypothetical protein
MPAYTSTTNPARTGFGTVPNPIAIPPNIFTQLSGTVPGFTANLSGAGNVIGAQLGGGLSQGTLNALKTGAAQFGTASGLGSGSGLEENQLFGNIAGFSEGQQQKGIQNLLSEIGTLGPTQTNPNLAAEISARNSNLAAAPDPKLAAQEQFNLWLKGASAANALGTPAGPWGAGGTLGPNRGFSTTHSNWGGTGMTPPDALGFPGYDMSGPGYGTMTATASPPPGGWPGAQPWNAGFAVGQPDNGLGGFYPGISDEEAAAIADQGGG